MEKVIDCSGIRLILGGDPVFRLESPFSDQETASRLRAAAFLLENKNKIEECSAK